MRNHAQLLVFLACLLGTAFLVLSTNCSAPKKSRMRSGDSGYSRMMSEGRAAFKRGAVEQAATLYRGALMRARAMDNSSAIGDAAYSLAACRVRQGQYGEARVLLAEAKTEISRLHGSLADILLVEAKVARFQDKPDEALALVEQALQDDASHTTDRHRVQLYVLRGHIRCDTGYVERANPDLKRATDHLKGISDPALRAEVSGLAGRLYSLQQEPVKAAGEFDHQASLLKQAALYQEMAVALRNAAEAHMAAGQNSLAADRFFRAARSTFALGDKEGAVKLGKMAISVANAAADEKAMARAQALLDEIEDTAARK